MVYSRVEVRLKKSVTSKDILESATMLRMIEATSKVEAIRRQREKIPENHFTGDDNPAERFSRCLSFDQANKISQQNKIELSNKSPSDRCIGLDP